MAIAKTPWKRFVSIGCWFVRDADDQTVFIINRTKDIRSEPEPGTRVSKTVEVEHADATCQMLFAAPEMLDTLRAVEMWLGTVPDGAAMQNRVRKAIILATAVNDGAEAERDAFNERT